jgi:long-chain acyl-CoA synthetase
VTATPALRYPGAHVKVNGDKPAVIMAETGQSLSYAQLDAYANRLARLYRSLDLEPGQHVAYIVENSLDCVGLQWGAHYAGLYYTFVSTRLLPGEASFIVEDCDAAAVVLGSKATPPMIQALQALPKPPRLYTLSEASAAIPSLHEALRQFSADPLENAFEGSEMLYSSGTTGRPRGVKPALTGKALGSTAVIADLMARGFGIDSSCVYLSPSPYYHAAPLKWVQGVTVLGGTAVLMEKFDAEGALQAIEKYRITHSQWVPTMFHRLLSLPDALKQRYDLSTQKMAVHAAAPCPIPIKEAMIAWWGPIVSEYYSCTEQIGTTFTDCAAWLKHPGTVGRPLYGKLHIVGEDGREVPVGEEGLVYFSGTLPFVYHKDAAATAAVYTADGWATVGDIGKLDADGFLYLTDRKSNMIISGGVNVYPQETENVLITHPQVLDAAVIGTPHEDFGEEVRAVVQLRPGVTPRPELAKELIAYCREHLSPIKSPRVVDFRETLPREPTGKLLKRLLREEYRAAFSKQSKG